MQSGVVVDVAPAEGGSQVAPPPFGVPLVVACRGCVAIPRIVMSLTPSGAVNSSRMTPINPTTMPGMRYGAAAVRLAKGFA
jgi:hypothetical protein